MDSLFAVHRLNDNGLRKADRIATSFNNLLMDLNAYCPEGRYLSLVKTKLEEASFFAKKSIAIDPENQIPEGLS